MSPSAILAISAALLNLVTAGLHLSLSFAPSWKSARAFAAIALTAALYCLVDVFFSVDGLSDRTYLGLGRLAYLLANVHVVAWLVYSFGGPEGSPRAMPRPIRRLAAAGLAMGVFFAITGLHLEASPPRVLEVAWAHSRYHYATTTVLGDVYGFAFLSFLLLPLTQVVGAVRRGEPGARLRLAGFAFFFLCSVDEVLVANGVLAFFSLGDVGFLSIVLASSAQAVRVFVRDARRLDALAKELEAEVAERRGEIRDKTDEVEARTKERDLAEGALVEVEQLAVLGRLAAGVGHEINNPLVYMSFGLDRVGEFVRSSAPPGEVREALEEAEDGVRRIQKVVEGLRVYSRRNEERAPLDLRDAVGSALKVAGPQLRHVARVDVDLEPVPRVEADEARLVQALVNLLINAGQAIAARGSAGGLITLRTALCASGEACVEVVDTGVGISPEHMRRLGEPYFTTRARFGAVGLGLFATRSIIGVLGGRLEFESLVDGGTTARVLLPALAAGSDAPRAERAPLAPPQALPHVRRRLLVVDDEPMILRSMARALKPRWEVTTAQSGVRALELLRGGARFDVIACDMTMPVMSGMELAEALSRDFPELRARMLFLTGGAASREAEGFLLRDDVRHLMKPVAFPVLEKELEALIAEGEKRAPG